VLILKTKKILLGMDLLSIFVIPAILITGLAGEYLIVFISIVLHELGHIFAAFLMNFKVYSLNILPIGLCAQIDFGPGSFLKRIFVYTAGPLTNLIIVILLMSSSQINAQTYSDFLISINVYLAFFNLLPTLPLDGGRIVNEVIAGKVGFFKAGRYMGKLSLILSITLLVAGTIQITGSNHNYSLLSIGIYILFLLRSEEGSEAIMNLKHIFYRRARLLKKGLYPARVIVAMEKTSLGEVIKNMDFDRFHLVHILDDNLKLIKVITEQDVIEAMVSYGTELTLRDFLSENFVSESHIE
jgi:stage IV sporulation protein FB